jgi:signal transduction histidine kinase
LNSRALATLILSALKYGGEGIGDSVSAAGRWVDLAVSDNGPGIAPEDRETALRRFSRLDNARTGPGAGLGLAMVSAVAQMHGGELVLGDHGGASGLSAPQGLVATLRLPRWG